MGRKVSKESEKRILEGSKNSAILRKKKSEERKKEYNKNPKRCLNCEDPIGYDKRWNKFCSRSCAISLNNIGRVRNGKKIEYKECLFCGDEFKPLRNSLGKYCSNKCQQDFEKKQYIEEIEESQNGNPRGQKNLPKFLKSYLKDKLGSKCSICGTENWMGKEVPLVLDHIDDNSGNDMLDNLRLVCGNCDMQLPTYKSKNKGSGRHWRRKRYKEGKSF